MARNATNNTTPPETGSKGPGFAKVLHSTIDRTAEVGLAGLGLNVMLLRKAWPATYCKESVAALAHDSAVDAKTIRMLLRKLEAAERIVIERQPGDENIYHLLERAPSEGSGENGRAPESVGKKRQGTPGENGRAPLPKSPDRVVEKEREVDKNGQTRSGSYPADFETWWAVYPRKVKKKPALPLWRNVVKSLGGDDEAKAKLLAITEQFAKSPAGNAGRYTPHPATWLNAAQHEDDQSEWNRTDDGDKAANPEQKIRMLGGGSK